jgi:lipopolysaccharide/colanic/teichoic acid biosynthesis glycosyltransferase
MSASRASGAVKVGAFIALLSASLVVGKVHADYIGNYDFTSSNRFSWVLAHVVIAALLAYAMGLPERLSFGVSLTVALVPSLVFAVLQTIRADFVLPRFFLLLSIAVDASVFMIASLLHRAVTRTSASRERIVLICRPDEALRIRKDVAFHAEIPCSIVGDVAPLSSFEKDILLKSIEEFEPSIVVYAADFADNPQLICVLTEIHLRGVRIRDVAGFYDEYIGKVPIRELASTALLFDVREIHLPMYSRLTRILDLVFAALGLLLLALILPLVWVGNLLGNRGHLFFAQERVGKGMKMFNIWKLRTMIPGDSTNQWTSPDDPRVTTFGRFLRATHLDELPQAWNILRGELALVGPRPEQPHYVEELSATIPFYATRHLVTPGLTGWAQVNYPYGSNHKDAYEKLQYEFWYLRHQQLSLDLKIIARTVRHVFGFQGR